MQDFAGVSIMREIEWQKPDAIISTDASLLSAGGVNLHNKTYFHLKFVPPYSNYKIHILEFLAIIACCKLYGSALYGKKLCLLCDNQAVTIAVNTGRAKDLMLQRCLRELFYVTSMFSFQVRCRYITSKENRLADYASRLHHPPFNRCFMKIAGRLGLRQIPANSDLLQFSHVW